jgi:hypothetical protein
MFRTQQKRPKTTDCDQEPAWAVEGSHVIPVNDLRPHRRENCWCRPVDDEGIVVHNSLDQREMYENGQIRIS